MYLWNGTGTVSPALLAIVEKIEDGYYDDNGAPVYGYKPAGIKVNYYSVTKKTVYVQLQVAAESAYSVNDLKPVIEKEIDAYFASLALGQVLIQTTLEAKVANIDGVLDVKLLVSLDNTTFGSTNLTCGAKEIFVVNKPLIYV
ncbi:hypothetical protein D3C81_1512780 [compost metagenome]